MNTCFDCENAVYIGEGAFCCTRETGDYPSIVIDEFVPTDDFLECGGADYSKENDE